MTNLNQIYELYFKDVYLFVFSMAKDQHIAEDVTSETFLKAIQKLDSYKGESDIKVWLFQIAKNTYFSYLRKHKRLTPVDEFPSLTDQVNIEKKLVNQNEAMAVHKILHSLPEPYKEVFTLRIFGNLNFKAIGEIFGKKDNWAAVTFHRAKQKIKEELRKQDETSDV